MIVLLLVGAMTVTSAADPIEHVSKTVDAEGAEQIDLDIEIGAGVLYIHKADMSELAKVEIDYTPRTVSYDVDYSVRGKTGSLYLESTQRRKRGSSDSENEWDIVLSNRLPLAIQLDIGACEIEMDLGGLRISNLSLDVGATSGEIDFSEPNPIQMRELDIDAGASSLELYNLANANFEFMKFSGGAASCELDFHGELKGQKEVDLEVGVGSLDVIIPRGVAVRFEGDADGWFSSVDFHGFDLEEVDDEVWETENFDDAKDRLIIKFEVAMGSIDLYSRR